jgi:long-chain acyl-CoA synthetase
MTLGVDDVMEHCRSQIAGYKCPRSIDFRDMPLPLSGAGKVLKRELREPYWKGFTKAVN